MEETDEKKEVKPKKRKSIVKRFFKFLLYIVVTFIALNVLLYALLSIPFVQQKIVNFAVGKLKTTLNTEVSIDEVRFRLFNHAVLRGIYIEDQSQDTLLYAQSLDVSLSPWELIRSKKLKITGISLDNFLINVNKKDSVSDFNFQFVIDAFASTDTVKTDTTKSGLIIVIKDIDIKSGRLNYNVLSEPRTPHIFNPSHIELKDFSANIDLNSIDPDKLDIGLNNLSAKEKTGLEIKELKGHLFSEKSKLWLDELSLSLPNSHLKIEKAQYHLSNGAFELSTKDTEIAPQDLIAFMPNLKYLTHNISMKTRIKGKFPAIDLEKIVLNYGDNCILEGHARISDYQKYSEADIDFSIDKFKITSSDITAFARLGDSTFVAPDILKTMGDIHLKAGLTGKLSNFDLNGETWSRHGSVRIATKGSIDSTFKNFNVSANLRTQNFNLGKVIGESSGLGRLTMNLSLRARQGVRQPLSAQVRGRIESLAYQKATLRGIPFEAHYNAAKMGLSLDANLPLGRVIAAVEMTQAKVPDINMSLNIEDLQVDRFYENENWKNPCLSFVLDANIKGLDIDNMSGRLVIDSLHFWDDNFSFNPKTFMLALGRNESDEKYISLSSGFFDAKVEGKYKFMALAEEFSNIMHGYLPSIFPYKKNIRYLQNDFRFVFSVENTEELTNIFALPASVIKPMLISGHINTIDHEINIEGSMPHISYDQIDIKGTKINIEAVDSAFSLKMGTAVTMNKSVYHLGAKIGGKHDAVSTFLSLKNDSIGINGQIAATAEFDRNSKNELVSLLKFAPSDIRIKDFNLSMLPSKITNVGERTEIDNFGIAFNNKRYFGIDGTISQNDTDSLKVYFDHAQIGDLLEAFDIKNIKATVNGNILLTNLMKDRELYTKNFSISDITVLNDTIGSIHIDSQWSEELGGIQLNAQLKQAQATRALVRGTVYTNRDSLDMKVHIDRLPLKIIEPFTVGMLDKLSGSLSSDLTINGTSKAPLTTGFLGFNDAHLGIYYTNVVYDISDTIQVSPDRIGFDNLIIKDPAGNTARMRATVTHANFQDMKYTLNMEMNRLMVLNTVHRTDSLFFGQLFASGNVTIEGDDTGINMNMQIRNERNSILNILLPQSAEANEYRSVVFINVPPEKLDQNKQNIASSARKTTNTVPVKLNMKLEVTPEIELGVIINPATGDAMQVKGNGVIDFRYDLTTADMRTFGNYILTDGSVRLNLQNISRLEFKIREGSQINFIGDPLKTTFNITAVRRVRSDLTTLDSSFGLDGTMTRVAVDCILGISGNKDKITLTYNIVLPDVSEDIQRKVNSFIVTEEDKLKQFAYLVMSGRFFSNTSNSNGSFGGGMWTNLASSTISSGLDAAFSGILGDKWQIGTNIESNDGTFANMDMTMNVSTKFFDDKLKFNTNLGYRTENSAPAENAFIGDFDLEYKLSNLWTLRAYSKANDQFYRQAPTTQGVGIVYTREASSIKRLFQSLRRRRLVPESQLSDSLKAAGAEKPAIIKEEKKQE